MTPPDPHPDDLWCQWEFGLKEDSKNEGSNTRRRDE
jgi:hypothetical protein